MKPGASIQAHDPLAQGWSNPAKRLLGRAYLPAILAVQAALLGYAYAVLSIPAAYTTSANTVAAIIWPAPALAAATIDGHACLL